MAGMSALLSNSLPFQNHFNNKISMREKVILINNYHNCLLMEKEFGRSSAIIDIRKMSDCKVDALYFFLTSFIWCILQVGYCKQASIFDENLYRLLFQ